MFEKFYDRPKRAQSLREGLNGHLLEGFAEELLQAGYAKITARRHIRAAEHLNYWTGRQDIQISALNEEILDLFNIHLDRCQCPHFGIYNQSRSPYSVILYLKYLRDVGKIHAPVAETREQDPVLLIQFRKWMCQQRGTSDLTLQSYSLSIRDLLTRLGEEPNKFDALSLRQFVIEKNQHTGWASAKKCTSALRMFLRFLIAEGKCEANLDQAIPVLVHWRLSSLPRYLQPEEVERIIISCDLNSPTGRRDRAIILLLARLGLRAGDIVKLRLSDIDWKGAEIHVSGKSRCQVKLPLTQEVGDALINYLQNGRHPTDTDVLFIRSRAPFRAFANHCAISVIVSKAMKRGGVSCRARGAAHLLRHSLATNMLQQGASLQDIAAILRHRSIETTQIYAKVDVTTLRQIAQPWPKVQKC